MDKKITHSETERKAFFGLFQTTGAILLLCGVCIIFLSLLLKYYAFSPLDIYKLLYMLLEMIGGTMLVSGFLTIILQLNNWKDYFERRIENILLEQEFIDKLDVDALKSLQTKTFRARHKGSDIDKEGSFLHHFEKNISEFIHKPYREDANMICNVDSPAPNEENVTNEAWITESLTYTCRMIGDGIQDSIVWKSHATNEFLDIDYITFSLRRSDSNNYKEVLSCQKNTRGTPSLPDDIDEHVYLLQIKNKNESYLKFCDLCTDGLLFNLFEHQEDLLEILVKTRYKIAHHRFNSWQMAYPTKSFSFSINYPKEWGIQVQDIVLMHNKISVQNNIPGSYSMQHKEWTLPNSGIVYTIVPHPNTEC